MKLLPYEMLLRKYNFDEEVIPCRELLQTKEWWSKREEIVKRDNYNCLKCRNGETIKLQNESGIQHFFVTFPDQARRYRNNYCLDGTCSHFYIYEHNDLIFTPAPRHNYLHVHHTYYKLDLLPWQYENDSLETLCVHCHFALHQVEKVPVYKLRPSGKYELTHLTCCSRCNGAGLLPEYDYYKNGICFRCWGAKYDELRYPSFAKKKSNDSFICSVPR